MCSIMLCSEVVLTLTRSDCSHDKADHLLVKIFKRKPRLLCVARAWPGLAAAAGRRGGKVLVP